ncbi:prenyltransferase/squalene oxidase repeat-containing protein [Actinomadura livida]|uniref:Squalene cyclase C-terminal domain-containing protein n=1 Tax=Actinomadura livida TaxID=79909 RepID=A0A7W7IJM0_9ACTN|nr:MULTISPECIES: prenyltransferase/squalene oxidase repeat-containing protein [Actinomadura]MBB4778322.1 hypothetical protein [Actinomadura catellatispora]
MYETGRVVSLAPWLTGHERRIAFLLDTQRTDGGWGLPHDGYALVPTLSATEALLSVLVRAESPDEEEPAQPQPAEDVADAAARGLSRLRELLTGGTWASPPGAAAQPDMPAIELIVPSLVERINRHLGDLGTAALPRDGLPLPASMDGTRLALVRDLLRSGARPPKKLMHALEIGGAAAHGFAGTGPESTGAIGASPAATAAWLGDRAPADPSTPARWYLETVAAMHDGVVPVAYPLTVFERGWVLSWLSRAGISVPVPPEVVLSLTAPLRAEGTATAAGLPADADTTAGTLYALALLGAPHPPDPLWNYETSTHFCTWKGEDGFSTTTNAHVLEAFGEFLATGAAARGGDRDVRRYEATIEKVGGWLLEQQRDDGAWTDRWHASPYYATASCALALERFGGAGRGADAAGRARAWILRTQRPDGSWGRWDGTAEETAYAVQTLLLTGRPPEPEAVRAAARGRDALLRGLSMPDGAHPPLWHDKDLYHPSAIVRAAILAGLHLIETAGTHENKE